MTHQTHTQPEFLTLTEAARLFRVCPRTLRRWIAAGQIPFVRIGRKFLFRREQVLTTGQTAITAADILA
jgi:excisionase family DNA binding protein